jgi:anti-sigma regulatory factor (Ser/Thr protein kinase)
MAEKKITISNRLDQLEVLANVLESLSDEWNIPVNVSLNLNLVLEELVTNIIFYGYDDTNEHSITIYLSYNQNIVQLRIEDDGRAFNPLVYSEPDIGASLENREIGGLGIHFVRKIMDNCSYSRTGNKNILTLTKNIV